MTENDEVIIEEAIALKGILKVLGWSRSKFFERKNDLLDAGVIFYRVTGKPPQKRIFAFQSRLQRYCGIMGARRESM